MAQENEKVDSVRDGEATENEPAYDSNDSSSRAYTPFKYQVIGLAMLNMIEAVVAVVVGWLVCLVLHIDIAVSSMIEVMILTGLIAAILEAALQVTAAKYDRNPESHEWPLHIAEMIIYAAISVAMAYFVIRGQYWFVIAIIATLVDISINTWAYLSKSDYQKEGISEEEDLARKSEEFKKMTEETFGDDIKRMKDAQDEKLDRYNKEHGVNKLNWRRKR